MYEPISVCVPAHNEEIGIGFTLDSILQQTYKGEMEILVCANACTDRTEDVAMMYERNFPSVKLVLFGFGSHLIRWFPSSRNNRAV